MQSLDPITMSKIVRGENKALKSQLDSISRERDFWRGEAERLRTALAEIVRISNAA